MDEILNVNIYEELFLDSFFNDLDGEKTIADMLAIFKETNNDSNTLIMFDDANKPKIFKKDNIIYYDFYTYRLLDETEKPILSRSYTDAHWYKLLNKDIFKITYKDILNKAKDISISDKISKADKENATIRIIFEETYRRAEETKSHFVGIFYNQKKLPVIVPYSNSFFKADKTYNYGEIKNKTNKVIT